MVKVAPGRVRTFGIHFDALGFDESRYSQLAAKALGVDHTQIPYDINAYSVDWGATGEATGAPTHRPQRATTAAIGASRFQRSKGGVDWRGIR